MVNPYLRYRTPAPPQSGGGRRVYEEFKPNSEWTHDHESYLLVIDLPGFTKEHLKITVTNLDTLTIRGERFIVDKWSRFSEEFKVPGDTEADSITAKFEAGFLRIRFPLRKDVKKTNYQSGVGKSTSREVSGVDPDSGSSSLCSACRLPIFSTPSIPVSQRGEESLFLHEQCSRSPEHLQHELHDEHDLVLLRSPTNSTATCRNCRELCGTMLYRCPYKECDFQLDLLCALHIKIVHRSHHHKLTAVRLRDFAPLTCNACDTKHGASSSSSTESAVTTISYLCNLCGFWVHPDCASLPNAILHYEDHKHSLFLTYNLPISADSKCFICSGVPKRTSGLYFCLKCPHYLVHIRCALARPHTFKPVFIRDALVTDLGRLPLANEQKSVIPYMREHAAAASTNSDDHYKQNLHSHPLIFHNSDDLGGGGSSSSSQSSRICNACVQFISPPFFSCSQCPDFFLHSCCANLPTQIFQHRVHEEHPLSLTLKAPKSDFSARFVCKGCGLWCNGFTYTCQVCDDFSMDVVCALINPAITHESHDKTHILFMSRDTDFGSDRMCNCCNSVLSGICYECSICRNFKLHARCALLPDTVRHVFDQHPLRLTSKKSTVDDDDDLCEICEEHLVKGHWFYSCGECDQSFHVDCIPSVDRLARMKLGSAVRVDHHGCPVALVRQDDGVCGGRRCGFCGEILKFSDDGGLAYECCKCFFSVHHKCVEKCLLES